MAERPTVRRQRGRRVADEERHPYDEDEDAVAADAADGDEDEDAFAEDEDAVAADAADGEGAPAPRRRKSTRSATADAAGGDGDWGPADGRERAPSGAGTSAAGGPGGDGEPPPERRERPGKAGRMSAAEAAEAALRNLTSLIGKNPEGITSVEPADDGWLVGIEIIEDQRIPSSADILAIYEAELAEDGSLMSYRRTKRYARGRGDSTESR